MSSASETCTRCGGPISRYAFTVATMDGQRHEICPVPPPTGEGASSPLELEEGRGAPPTEAATFRRALLNVLSLAGAAGGTIGATDAVAGIVRIARQALAAEHRGARSAEVPKGISPAIQRTRWLAARPSNALCDHPACHAGKDPCDEYRLRAAARTTAAGAR